MLDLSAHLRDFLRGKLADGTHPLRSEFYAGSGEARHRLCRNDDRSTVGGVVRQSSQFLGPEEVDRGVQLLLGFKSEECRFVVKGQVRQLLGRGTTGLVFRAPSGRSFSGSLAVWLFHFVLRDGLEVKPSSSPP